MSIPNRYIHLFIVLSIAGLMGYALYTQYFQDLEPCTLCMTQRVCYLFAGFFSLLAFIFAPKGFMKYILNIFALIGTLAGVFAAGRQVWLQHLPEDKVPACGPGFEYALKHFPFSDKLKTIFLGDGDCAEVVWQFMGLSMPEWSLLWFVGLSVLIFWSFKKN